MSNALDVFKLPLSGKFLIEAGAGTGKTYSISSLYLRVLIEKKLMPNHVLVLTFTNDATNELKQRLRARIQEVLEVYVGKKSDDEFITQCASNLNAEQSTHLQQCLYSFDEAAVATIHGFCQRLLSENAIDFEVSPNFELLSDELSLLTEATDNFWIQFFYKSINNIEFERWYKTFFEEIFVAPEDFIKKYREILLNVDLDISRYRASFDDYITAYEKAVSTLESLKISAEEHESELWELFENGPLSGTYYKNKPQMVEEFLQVVRTSSYPGYVFKNAAAKADSVEDRFIKFGNYIHDHLLKNKTINHIALFDRVDEFYTANQQLLEIKKVFLHHAIIEIRERFSTLKQARNMLGYNDLILKVRDTILQKPNLAEKIKRRYPVAFIDEFQDTDHIQFSIFQQLFENNPNVLWVMIGDPKQAIYRFRGADINTYLYAKKGIEKNNHRTLLHNYRSSEPLIYGVNAFFNYADEPFGLSDLHFYDAVFPPNKPISSELSRDNKNESPISVIEFDQNGMSVGDLKSKVMDSVCSEIIAMLDSEFLIDDRKVSTSDIAILVDKHMHASELQEKLKKRGLKSIIRSKASVFKTQEADDLYRILRAISEFENEHYIRAAMLTGCLRFNSNEVIELFESENNSNEIIQRFSELHERWQKDGFSKFIKQLMASFTIEENLAMGDQPERALTNIYHLLELLVKEVRLHGYGVQSLLRYFQEKKENPNSENDAEIIRLESDGDLIQIVTHHSSKGLEYPIVFCPFLWDMRKDTPDYVVKSVGRSTKVIIKDNSEEFKDALATYKKEELSEQKRLIYVALTRAELKCFVYIPIKKKIDRAKGRNTIKYLWDENVKPQLDQLNEIEVKALKTNSTTISVNPNRSEFKINTVRFSRTDIWQYPRVVSYSSLSGVKQTSFEEIDFKDVDPVDTPNPDELINEPENSVFNIPKGKNTGNLVHAIFEDLDFTDSSQHREIIQDKMETFNVAKKWEAALSDLVDQSLSVVLKNETKLRDIKNDDKLVEMEFYVPIQQLSKRELFEALGKHGKNDFEQIDGFLKGFIDLIFRVGDTYYILDYKTNHLGSTFEDYAVEALAEEMRASNYDIQYHLYTLALYRYLKTRIPDFDYSKHFGGVFYLFVRGVNPEEPGSGVFYDKPDQELIAKLDYLIKEVQK